MAAPIDVAVFKDGLIVLGVAAVLVPLARRLGITPVVTFLAAGAVFGPFGLAALDRYPIQWWPRNRRRTRRRCAVVFDRH